MHFYIKWQAWSLGLSCTIDGSRIEGHASLSSTHDGKHGQAHMCLKSYSICCLSSVAVKTVFCRKFLPTGRIQCRPAIGEWPITPSAADGNYTLPVGISSSRWYSTVCKEPVPELWHFSEKQGSKNRGSNGMVRAFWARRVRACITRASRGRGCGHLSSFFAFILIIN